MPLPRFVLQFCIHPLTKIRPVSFRHSASLGPNIYCIVTSLSCACNYWSGLRHCGASSALTFNTSVQVPESSRRSHFANNKETLANNGYLYIDRSSCHDEGYSRSPEDFADESGSASFQCRCYIRPRQCPRWHEGGSGGGVASSKYSSPEDRTNRGASS